MPDDQPDIPDAYADLVAALVDTNSGTVKPDRVVTPTTRHRDPARGMGEGSGG